MMPVITATELTKRYRRRTALDAVSLSIAEGETVGLLGRNGAGKTTLVETVAGLRRADEGTVRVFGLDPWQDRARLRMVLGVQTQDAVLHGELTVAENLRLHRTFYRDGHDPDMLLDRLGLSESRQVRFSRLSGGQQQRLSVAVALIGRPRMVILDELTTGLDPQMRRGVWSLVAELRTDGVTVVLVSHAMDEVARLCDRVIVLDQGRIRAQGTPDTLISQTGASDLDEAFLQLSGSNDKETIT